MGSTGKLEVKRWSGDSSPNEAELRRILDEQGLSGYRWSNSPGDVYDAHNHRYNKIIYVVHGSITFILPEVGQQVTLEPGDRLYLPEEMIHRAIVGQQGVICLEAHQIS